MHITQDGYILKTNEEFQNHMHLNVPVDVEYTNDTGVLTTGIIQEFTEEYVKINDYAYNRQTLVFISRPNM
ncbi:hypothetical protein [Priestia koreensis]|uniref:Uncharacterized protein n=1 Tax=Priestia koreensis TaxID=284581 RepID=A0A0M0L5Q6_9BACI|nr:hypothetical protein [Priestia koreensis]KOO46406.1 hypothetical protein AMD01_11270 [Priestia koreensis]